MQPEKIEEEKVEVTYKDTFRFIWYYMRERRAFLIVTLILVMMANIVMSITPIYAGKIIDAMNMRGDNATDAIWSAFWALICLKMMQHVFYSLSWFLLVSCEFHAMSKIVNDLSSKIQSFSSEWHLNSFGGSTMRTISRGQWSLHDAVEGIVANILPVFFLVTGLIVMLSIKMPIVGLTMGVMVVIYIAMNIFSSTVIMAPRFKKSVDQDNKTCGLLGDIITSNQVVKSFGAEKKEASNVKKSVEKWRIYSKRAWFTGISLSSCRHIINVIITGIVISLVIFLWQKGEATSGDIAVVITATSLLAGHITNIGKLIEALQRSFNELRDAVAVWMREEDVCDIEDAVPLVLRDDTKENKIVFEDVGFIYPKSDVGLFKKLSLKIKAGEHVALVGTSGSGKSTFVKLLQRLYNINEGKIRIDGQNISRVTLESLRQSISLVPQDPILFHRSLKENIAYGKSDALMEEIIEASKKAHIYEFISSLPEGFDTEVGERGIKLSGGERQRVAIARAILADKPILVLDEATSSLDSVSEQYIKDAMEELVKGKTTITIAHRLSTVRKSDRILVFSKGKIIEQGKHDELMADSTSQYKKLYDTQSLGIVIRDNDDEVKK